jgi:hypothetical protein
VLEINQAGLSWETILKKEITLFLSGVFASFTFKLKITFQRNPDAGKPSVFTIANYKCLKCRVKNALPYLTHKIVTTVSITAILLLF